MDNRHVGIIQEGFNLVVRVGGHNGLAAARKLYSEKLMFVASPDYIRQHGQPVSLEAV